MKLDFTDKRVLVTGGTRGIGRAVVEAFLECGARVAVNGSTAESTARAVAELDAGDRVVAAPGSVAEVEGCRAIAAVALEGLGGLDVLVNNAGFSRGKPIEEFREEIWDQVIDTNLKGTFYMTQMTVAALRESKGAIVNFSSVFGLVGAPGGLAYSSAKAGIVNLTRSLALALAPDVRVNAICPGGVDTDMLRALAVKIAGDVEKGYEILSQDAAQKRIAHPREIAGPVLYLASDLASFVTGSIHVVDGGETID